MKLDNRTYDVMKWLVLCVIPALTTFFCVCDKCFSWGYAEVVATISAALCTCLGTILGISTAQYNKKIYADSSSVSYDDLKADADSDIEAALGELGDH